MTTPATTDAYQHKPTWPPVPPRRRRVGLRVVAGFVAALALVAGSVAAGLAIARGRNQPDPATSPAASKSATEYTVTGDMELTRGWSRLDAACFGQDGFEDIRQDAQVTVTDATGTVVAIGTLQAGRLAGTSCWFGFAVEHVPAGRRFYGVEVAHRGVVRYAEDRVSALMHLTLG